MSLAMNIHEKTDIKNFQPRLRLQAADMKKIPFGSGGTILIICMVPQLVHAKIYGFEVA